MRTVGVDVFGVALTTPDIRSHLARKTHGLLVSAESVARPRMQFSGMGWWGQGSVCVGLSAWCLGGRVGEVVLSSSGSTALKFAGPRTSQWCLTWKWWWRRRHGNLLR